MDNATNEVVMGKLEPVGKVDPTVPATCTAQGLYELHGKPWAAESRKQSNAKAKRLLAAANVGVSAYASKGQTGLLEFYSSLAGMAALARKAIKDAKAADKENRERDSASIAVFASSIKPIVAAVVFKRLSLDDCKAYVNYMELLTACRRALEGDEKTGQPHIDFEGRTVAHGAAKVEQRLNREAARAAGKAAEKAIMAGMTPQQAAHLMAESQKAARSDAAADIREKAIAAGAKFGAALAERQGKAAALEYLKAALAAAEKAA
jgi:hypothetical protein